MSTATNQNSTPEIATASHNQNFPPIELITRSHIPTDQTAFYLSRKAQTLRAWASLENGPIRPIRINGRLAWPVAEIKKILGLGV